MASKKPPGAKNVKPKGKPVTVRPPKPKGKAPGKAPVMPGSFGGMSGGGGY